jgi:hypothetical protein
VEERSETGLYILYIIDGYYCCMVHRKWFFFSLFYFLPDCGMKCRLVMLSVTLYLHFAKQVDVAWSRRVFIGRAVCAVMSDSSGFVFELVGVC